MRKKGDIIAILLAGVRFEIEPVDAAPLARRLAGYELPSSETDGASVDGNDAPPVFVRMTKEDVEKEKELTLRYWEKEGLSIPDVDDSYFEYTALHKKVLEELIGCQVLHLHGSAICVNRQGYLFTAPSGTGKSTHARLWRERFGEEVIMINDDKPLIRVEKEEIYLCGSPWNGKHGLGRQVEVPLRAIVKLRRGDRNRIAPLDHAASFRELYLQTYHFEDKEKMQAALGLIAQIIERVRFYDLRCNMEPEAADVARKGIELSGAVL